MSATNCRWMCHTASISGAMVAQPSGPGGRASVPAASAALVAAASMARAAASAGRGLGTQPGSGGWLTNASTRSPMPVSAFMNCSRSTNRI